MRRLSPPYVHVLGLPIWLPAMDMFVKVWTRLSGSVSIHFARRLKYFQKNANLVQIEQNERLRYCSSIHFCISSEMLQTTQMT